MSRDSKIKFDTKGILRLLDRLPARSEKKIVPGALKAGAKPIVKQARKELDRQVTHHTRNLRKSIGSKRDKRLERRRFFRVRVGARSSGKYLGYHGHLIEYGHDSKRNGPVKARPFLRPASRKKASKAIDTVKHELAPRIKKEARRLSR